LIAQHVTSQLTSFSGLGNRGLNISSIDLRSHPLPLLDESGIPAKYPAANPTPHYTHEHSRAWSTEILKHSAFIFVTPQYNWGYPAAIKNAIDYLFHEWTGKPALVVSYGGHGGGKAAAQLVQVCEGLRMKAVVPTVGYKINLEESQSARERGGFDGDRLQFWKTESIDDELKERFEDLVGLLN
jgi:NAD(P)H-dependent FMN reductase